MKDKALTEQQEKVLKFVDEFLSLHGFPPTLREIGDAVNLVNINAVRGHLAALEKKGYISKTPDKARSIQRIPAPTVFSRLKRKLHEVLGTDEGVFHRIIYGLGWTINQRKDFYVSLLVEKVKATIERQAVEHGWEILEVKIEHDYVVVIVAVWPNHSAEQTVRRIQTAISPSPTGLSGYSTWGKGYVATTDLDVLDSLMDKLLKKERGL